MGLIEVSTQVSIVNLIITAALLEPLCMDIGDFNPGEAIYLHFSAIMVFLGYALRRRKALFIGIGICGIGQWTFPQWVTIQWTIDQVFEG